jgi:hypothetical protein
VKVETTYGIGKLRYSRRMTSQSLCTPIGIIS